MGRIVKNLKVFGEKDNLQLNILFDSGASFSLIRSDIANKLTQHFVRLKKKLVLSGFNGKSVEEVKETCTLQIQIKKYTLPITLYVVKNMKREIIIGVDFMQSWKIVLDLKNENFTIGVNPKEIEIV